MIPLIVPLVTASEVAFWICAPLMVLGALNLVIVRKPVYSALSLVMVMIGLAIQYAAMDAPFLFVVQIIVYAGAIMMLFLFVLMIVGVDTRESFVETIKHQRAWAIVAVLAFAAMLLGAIGSAVYGTPAGFGAAHETAGGPIEAIAQLLFTRYVFVFEATSALLITAAIAAMVLAHGEKIMIKKGQKEQAADRIAAYAESGEHMGPKPPPGVFARHNAIETPALLPDGSVAEESVSKVLAERVTILNVDELGNPTKQTSADIEKAADDAKEVNR